MLASRKSGIFHLTFTGTSPSRLRAFSLFRTASDTRLSTAPPTSLRHFEITSAPTTRAKRKLLLDSDIDSSSRLVPSERDSPTPSTPPIPVPAAAQANDSDGIKQARSLFESNVDKVGAIYAKG
ncbi:hypothetical protein CYMTET_11619 [Cymbomonas tetramitiformis]|uniref:Uncharacterized protein n=1 Tax=Cymbomonas tetramitiformis TaxID=36881 RepID=A0AAE0LCU6_9CHLO|nr:hypothetical protein CYMTET_11619 [Cymbomonas tetramitiformis]